MVEAMLRECGAGVNGLEQPARAWLRQLKRTRRAAGEVRDVDVHRKLLERWMGKSTSPGSKAGALGMRAETMQAEALDTWLKAKRGRLATDMQKQIRKRQPRLVERQAALFIAIAGVPLGSLGTPRPADAVALEDFVHAAEAMPVLHTDNLHDFRKATKKARYVAESGGQKCSSLAGALKRVQDAIGDWHDWLCIAQEVTDALGQDARALKADFEAEVERHFAAAIKTTQTMRGLLVGEWLASLTRNSPPKRPPMAAAIGNRRVI